MSETREQKDKKIIHSLRIKIGKSRNFPHNTCPASRHVQMMANQLIDGYCYQIEEEPEHVAISMLSVVNSLYKARTRIEELEAERALK